MPLSASLGCLQSLACGCFLHLQRQDSASPLPLFCIHSFLSLSSSAPSSTFKDPCGDTGSTQIIQDNIPMLRSPDQQTYLILSVTQIPLHHPPGICTDSGNKTQTALKGCNSADHRPPRQVSSSPGLHYSFRFQIWHGKEALSPPETERLCTEVNTAISQVSLL